MTLIQFVRENLDSSKKRGENQRLWELAKVQGFTSSLASVNTAIAGVRREAKGLSSRPVPKGFERGTGIRLLEELQVEITQEVGFQPTLSQVVERLVKVYREKQS